MGFRSERSRIVDTHLEIFIFYVVVGQSDHFGFCFALFVCEMLDANTFFTWVIGKVTCIKWLFIY